MVIEDYFKTHYSVNDKLVSKRYTNLWDDGENMVIIWMQTNIRKAMRNFGYTPTYLVDRVGVDLYCHFTKNKKLQQILKNVDSEYLVVFCNKVVWDEASKNFRYMPHPSFLFTKDLIEQKNGLTPYDDRMYNIVG